MTSTTRCTRWRPEKGAATSRTSAAPPTWSRRSPRDTSTTGTTRRTASGVMAGRRPASLACASWPATRTTIRSRTPAGQAAGAAGRGGKAEGGDGGAVLDAGVADAVPGRGVRRGCALGLLHQPHRQAAGGCRPRGAAPGVSPPSGRRGRRLELGRSPGRGDLQPHQAALGDRQSAASQGGAGGLPGAHGVRKRLAPLRNARKDLTHAEGDEARKLVAIRRDDPAARLRSPPPTSAISRRTSGCRRTGSGAWPSRPRPRRRRRRTQLPAAAR